MKIAVTSQNRSSITKHVGRCRKFWTYGVDEAIVTLETDPDQAVVAYLDGSMVIIPLRQHNHHEEPEGSHACHCSN